MKDYYTRNKDKIRKAAKEYYEKNKEKIKENSRKYYYNKCKYDISRTAENRFKKYGITLEEYLSLHKEQQGLCAICGKAESSQIKSGKQKSLAVDHCHETGKVRGLLCFKCNSALGKFNDDPDLLRKAIIYIGYHLGK